MGREVKRVPIDFDWPLHERWWGFCVHVDFPECPTCKGDGWSKIARNKHQEILNANGGWAANSYTLAREYCEERNLPWSCWRCDGEGQMKTPEQDAIAESDALHVAPPIGDGYQLWETVSEGSPISPVFVSPEDLAYWMVEEQQASTIEVALKFIEAGWAPSMVISNGVAQTGVEFAGSEK